MADNVQLSTNVGTGAVAAADDIGGGVYAQRIKLIQGADGVNDGDVALGNPLPTRSTGSTASVTSLASSAASQTLLSATAGRLRAWMFNDTDKICYVKFGTTASAASYTKKLLPQDFFTVEGYTGRIDVVWQAAPTGNMLCTEMTA